jgi:hypothetical protein
LQGFGWSGDRLSWQFSRDHWHWEIVLYPLATEMGSGYAYNPDSSDQDIGINAAFAGW